MQRTERCNRIHVLMIVLSVTLAATVTCVAQEAGFVDLTTIAARTELRHPVSQDDRPAPNHAASGKLSGCFLPVGNAPALRTTLLWLDRSEYQAGDEEKFEVQIENVGSAPISIPFSPHLADLQPEDPRQKFKYSTLIVVLWLGGELWSESQSSGSEIALYGSDDHPDTMLTLRPGQWVQVIGKGKFTLSNNVLPLVRKGDAASYANANVSIYGVETKLSATASATIAQGGCLIQSQGPHVAVKVSAPK
jgi:hypothetical protein